MAVRMMFEISGDSTHLLKAITGAMNKGEQAAKVGGQKAGSEFGKEFGNQVKGAIMSAIGIGAITAAIKKSVTDAQVIAKEAATSRISVEAAQELQRAAKLTGMSVEDIKASATTAPKEFSALMRYVQKTGGPKLDAADVEQLTSTGDLFSGLGSAISKVFAKSTAFIGGGITDIAGRAALGIGSGMQMFGAQGATSERMLRAGVMLEGMRDRQYERGFGIAEGRTSPSGDLVRKLDEIKKTLEKKL